MAPEDKEPKQKTVGDETRDRREFLKRIGKGSAAVPAAVLLLSNASASAMQFGRKKAKPQISSPSGGCGSGCGSG